MLSYKKIISTVDNTPLKTLSKETVRQFDKNQILEYLINKNWVKKVNETTFEYIGPEIPNNGALILSDYFKLSLVVILVAGLINLLFVGSSVSVAKKRIDKGNERFKKWWERNQKGILALMFMLTVLLSSSIIVDQINYFQLRKLNRQIQDILRMVMSNEIPAKSVPKVVSILESSMINTFPMPIFIGIQNSATNIFSQSTPAYIYTKFQRTSEIYTLQKKNEIISEFLEKDKLLDIMKDLVSENQRLRKLHIYTLIAITGAAAASYVNLYAPFGSIDPKKTPIFFIPFKHLMYTSDSDKQSKFISKLVISNFDFNQAIDVPYKVIEMG